MNLGWGDKPWSENRDKYWMGGLAKFLPDGGPQSPQETLPGGTGGPLPSGENLAKFLLDGGPQSPQENPSWGDWGVPSHPAKILPIPPIRNPIPSPKLS